MSGEETRENYLRIFIADEGEGIPTGHEQDVYLPFERLGRESGTIEGTGIGLTIAKRIIQMLNGEIGYTPNQPKGGIFWVDIPISRQQSLQDNSVSRFKTSDTYSQDASWESQTILYVEDSQANMKLMERVLARLPNLSMLSATTAEQGLEMARQHQPQLILMDINLPGMNGIEALKQLLNTPETSDIPVVAVSADAMPRDIEAAMAVGFRNYITKPIDVTNTLQIVKTLLGRTQSAGRETMA